MAADAEETFRGDTSCTPPVFEKLKAAIGSSPMMINSSKYLNAAHSTRRSRRDEHVKA